MIRLSVPALAFLLLSCSGGSTNEELLKEASAVSAKPQKKVSDEVVSNILNSIPSPLEISSIIKESGGKYNSDILNSPSNSSRYNTSFKKAINLGIYSTDLGYINIYEQNTDALLFLASVKKLADGLNIGQFFDMATIKNLATNSDNIDSLMRITTGNFENINRFLQKNQRSEQSVFILTGGWIEALHISCQVAAKNDNPQLMEKIGEQKIILDQLILLLSNYSGDLNVDELSADLKALQKIYNEITISYEYREPTMKEVDGMLVIVDESESKVNITKQHLNSITEITGKLRGKIIN